MLLKRTWQSAIGSLFFNTQKGEFQVSGEFFSSCLLYASEKNKKCFGMHKELSANTLKESSIFMILLELCELLSFQRHLY